MARPFLSTLSTLFKGASIVVLGLFGTIGGSVAAVFLTPAGRGLAGRTLSEQLDRLVNGDIQVGAVGGALWSGIEVDNLVIRDTADAIVLEADHLAAHYHPVDLLAGRVLLTDVKLIGPRVILEKRRDGSWNVSRIFISGSDSAGTKAPPLVRLEDVEVRDGEMILLQPWDPPDSMRTPGLIARALAHERALPGRVIDGGPEGYRKQTTFKRIGGRFAELRLSSPDHAPLRAEFDSLAVVISDPILDLRTAEGSFEFANDRMDLDLSRAVLPDTRAKVAGSVIFARQGPRFDLRAESDHAALRDLRGFVTGLPDLTGSTRAHLHTRADGRIAAAMSDLRMEGPLGAATGRLTAVAGANRPLALEDLDLVLRNVAPKVLSGWVDSIPLEGRIDGRVQANGPMTGLTLDVDVTYRDDRVTGRPANRLSAVGVVRFSEGAGMVFDPLTLRQAELDLPTVTVLVPSNPLVGRASVEGTLQGPWRAFTWRGTALHRDGDRPVSAVRGTVFLDTRRAVTSFSADLGLMPLSLDGLAGAWPDLPIHGTLRGVMKAEGTAEQFGLTADLDGSAGHVVGAAALRHGVGGWGADSLAFAFDSLDLAAVAGPRSHTQLLGSVRGHGTTDAAGHPIGALDLRLGLGWIREVPIDSARLRITADSFEVRVDTAFVRWFEGMASAGGTLAQKAPGSGTMRITIDANELSVFDSLVSTIVPPANDTTSEIRPLNGHAALAITLSGGLDAMTTDAHLDVRELGWRNWSVPSAGGDLRIDGAADGALLVNLEVDSASRGGWAMSETTIGLRGRLDSLDWSVRGRLGPTDTVLGTGSWAVEAGVNRVRIDTLRAAMTAHTWELAHATHASGRGTAWRVDSLVLLATDGSGEFRVAGSVPGDTPGEVTMQALGVDLRDLGGIFQTDTVGLQGRVAADVRITGTGLKPEMRGTFSLAEGGYRDFRAPFMQGALDYADRRLQAGVVLWRTGKVALSVDSDLPIDLAFTDLNKRMIDGPLSVRAIADSADLGLLEAFTKNLRRVRGALQADVTLTGRWGDTRFGGSLQVTDAAATLPGLGVRWEGLGARVHLSGDSMVVDTLFVRGGQGTLGAQGLVRFERRRQPWLDIKVRADRFRAMDVRNYLTLVTSLRGVRLSGPLFGATLTGNGSADEGALYFADLVTKQIVNLDDPATAELVDTALVRSARLGPSFQNRFVDSLRISGFSLAVGTDFWLRSADANIKLTGQAQVNKVARNYRLDGTLTAERGQYSLKLGPITRDFEVRRGTVRFLGTPDLNAELDLTATHHVKPQDGSAEIDLTASITGTLLVPKLTLLNTSDPGMSETDIVAYLMFGRSAGGLQTAGVEAVGNTMTNYILPALSSEFERTLISDLGVPVDYIQIEAGGFGSNTIDSPTSDLTTVTAGWQLGRETFVAVNAGVCLGSAMELSYRNFGASLEQRLSRAWRATLSVEPVFTCSNAPGTTTLGTSTIYQLGVDLLWDREY